MKKIVVIGSGMMGSALAFPARENGNDVTLVGTPLDEEIIINSARKTGKVITAEEHSIIGGLGSAVAECLSENLPTPLYRIGVRDRFGESGPSGELIHKYQLDGEGVTAQIKAYLAK